MMQADKHGISGVFRLDNADHPILNSPYEWSDAPLGARCAGATDAEDYREPPSRRVHHADSKAEETERRLSASEIVFDEGKGLSTEKQQYDPTSIINELVPSGSVASIAEPQPLAGHSGNSPSASALAASSSSAGFRPFFCQVEAVETAIWLTEVAPQIGKDGKVFLEHLANANQDANPELMRLALKLATGAGKTTVMAMLIAWQTINAVRRPRKQTVHPRVFWSLLQA